MSDKKQQEAEVNQKMDMADGIANFILTNLLGQLGQEIEVIIPRGPAQ